MHFRNHAGQTHAGQAVGITWTDLHRRLDATQQELARRLNPDFAEQQKILQARARSLAETPRSDNVPRQSLLDTIEFTVASERYGVEMHFVREICALQELTTLPGAPNFILGITNLHGQILSVVDIRRLFELPERGITNLNKVIALRANDVDLGILADAVLGVRSIASDELGGLPTFTGIRKDYLKGITKEAMVVLDVQRIVASESRE